MTPFTIGATITGSPAVAANFASAACAFARCAAVPASTIGRRADDVGVRREVHRAGAFGGGDAQRPAHYRAGVLRQQVRRPFRDRREQAGVIEHLVGEGLLAAPLDLAGDRKQRHLVEKGARHRVH